MRFFSSIKNIFRSKKPDFREAIEQCDDQDTKVSLILAYLLESSQKRFGIGHILAIGFIFAYIITTLYGYYLIGSGNTVSGEYASVVRINGVIQDGGSASYKKISVALREAFEDERSKGVIMVINSPGGTPTQSELIRNDMIALKSKHKKKIFCVAEDQLTSGAILISTGCDEVFAQPTSMVGSIGVIFSNFGYKEVMDKVGVERRTITAGDHKSFMSPYKKLTPQDESAMRSILVDTHEVFKSYVVETRGDKLAKDVNLFTGEVWTGRQALKLGLIDGLKDLYSVMDEKFGVSQYRDFSASPGLMSALGINLQATIDSAVSSAIKTLFTSNSGRIMALPE